jgi:hypothetical protein
MSNDKKEYLTAFALKEFIRDKDKKDIFVGDITNGEIHALLEDYIVLKLLDCHGGYQTK